RKLRLRKSNDLATNPVPTPVALAPATKLPAGVVKIDQQIKPRFTTGKPESKLWDRWQPLEDRTAIVVRKRIKDYLSQRRFLLDAELRPSCENRVRLDAAPSGVPRAFEDEALDPIWFDEHPSRAFPENLVHESRVVIGENRRSQETSAT